MTGLYTHALPRKITPQTKAEHRNLWVYGAKRLYCVLDEFTEGTFEGVLNVHEAKSLIKTHGMDGLKLYVSFAPPHREYFYRYRDYLRMFCIKFMGDDLPQWLLRRFYPEAMYAQTK